MKKQGINKWFLILILVLSTVLLASCSSGNKIDNALTDIGAAEGDTENVTDETADKLGADVTADKLPQDAKIIREITVSGETKNFEDASEEIKDLLTEAGGYVEKSDVSGGETLRNNRKTAKTGTFILRIPADKLDVFLEQTKGLLNITASKESTTDVTLEYYDVEARLNTLKTKKTALEDMLEKAESLNDMLLIQDNLYQVIADIEAYQSRLNTLDSKVDYSTITLTVHEVVEYTEIEEEDFWTRIKNAFVESWQNFGEFIQNFAVAIVYCLPGLLVFGVIILIVLAILLISKRKNKNKKNDK